MTPWRGRGDLVISMTLAETFLLLLFMVWYSSRPSMQTQDPCNILEAEIQRLNAKIQNLENEKTSLQLALDDLNRRLEFWRKTFGRLPPGSPEEFREFTVDLGRGKPKCQVENVLVEVFVVNGATSMKVLAECPGLTEQLRESQINFAAGNELRTPREIAALLRRVSTFRKNTGEECRFDYRLRYATAEDYYIGRERFERYFYPAGHSRVAKD